MKFSLYSILLVLAICVVHCSREPVIGNLNVVVSIVPLQDFVEKVGGERVHVTVMVSSGASPHAYEPSPRQLAAVSNAQMYVKVGTPVGFEVEWLPKILAMNSMLHVCDASANIELVNMGRDEQGHDRGFDPHVWLSPANAKIMVNAIYEGLVVVDPDNEAYYKARCDAYQAELDSLHTTIEHMLSGKKNRQFIVYHPAWGYFAREYDLEQIAVEMEGKEPTARSMGHVIEKARAYNVRVIFVSPQFSKKSAQVIAQEIGGRVVTIDPLARDYVTNMRTVARVLFEAME